MDRTFLHIDMDAFFAAVEQRDRPELKGKPVVVGSPPDQRGVVAAASYEARKYGIHSAMPSREAGQRCPHAVFVQPDFARYQEASEQVFAIFERFTPMIEPLSIDEAFLDITGAMRIYGSGEEIAEQIRAAIRKETGLTASVGIAPNKFLAKLASEMNKPDGVTVVPRSPAAIMAFLAPLPIRTIWGIGKVAQRCLEDAGIYTVGDLQNVHHEVLAGIIGKHAASQLKHLARGEDSREIETEHEEKSISHEHTFLEDCSDVAEVERVLSQLVDDVGSRLRAAGKYAACVHLKLRWKGFKTITRQRTLQEPRCDTFTLNAVAIELFREQDIEGPIRLVGMGVSHLAEKEKEQLTLFDDHELSPKRKEQLSRTVDFIRAKFGRHSIQHGTALEDRE